MIKSEYLGDTIYFKTFEECRRYYNFEDAEDLWDLQEALKHEADGMAYPELTEEE